MFAVIKTGGKQYKVAANDEITIERLETAIGEEHTFDEVLMLGEESGVKLGTPAVEGASVTGEVVDQRKGDKVMIFKKRQRSTYRRKKGHRQPETLVRITAILPDGVKALTPKKKAETTNSEEATVIETPVAASPSEPSAADAPVDARGRLSEALGEADDLKKIKGVGKVLEGKLNGAGIFHFWQVAALTGEQIAELEDEMSFPGRVERDEWVKQAGELAGQS